MQKSFNKIHCFALKQFTAFEDAIFEFCPGINVLIGLNSTGKTLTIKMLYAILRICQATHQRKLITDGDSIDIIVSKLQGIFQPRHLSNLIHWNSSDKKKRQDNLEVFLEFSDTTFGLKIESRLDEKDQKRVRISPTFQISPATLIPSSIYLPPQELLSINQGFISLYQNRELPYDETYYDLSLALNAVPLRNEKLIEIQEILTFIETIITGESDHIGEGIITQDNNQFYFDLPEGRFETHLVAEGYRKIATLLYLLKNGMLTKDSILFWDEPEANLNPQLTVQLVRVLNMLASTGMQIFITTHDYLLSHELSLLKEYQTDAKMDMKFFALEKSDRRAGVKIKSGNTLPEIQHNPILEEFAAHYDREVSLFDKHSSQEERDI